MPARFPTPLVYPVAPTSETVDVYHGETVADPYRPLEDPDLPATAEWARAQAEIAERLITAIPSTTDIRETVARLIDYPRAGVPVERGGRWFRMRNAGLEAQDSLWVADEPTSLGRSVIDPADWSDEGLAATSATSISPDGRLVAYARSESGSDWQTWSVRCVESGTDLDDHIEWSKFSNAQWLADSSGFFYTAAKAPQSGGELTAATGALSVMLHRIGDDPSFDEVIFASPEHPEWIPVAWVSEDGRHLVVTLQHGTDERTALWHRRLDRPTSVLEALNAPFAAAERVVGVDGDELFVRSDRFDAKGEILVASPIDHRGLTDVRGSVPACELPSRHAPAGSATWRTVVAATDDTLLDATALGGHLVCHYLHRACSTLRVFGLDGRAIRDIPLPALSSVSSGPSGRQDSPTVLFSVESFLESGALWSHDLDSGDTKVLERSNAAFDASRYVTEQVFVESSGSVLVSMFVVRSAQAVADSANPVLLYGYGGFAVPITPSFSTTFAAWLKRGGMVAVANVRGGGEFGREWHDAGRLKSKQNVFDDLCACARWLATSGWSTASKVALNGASNGGLAVGACVTQHPELFGAAVAEVGVLDMLRFHLFTIGWAWKADYGDPEVAEQYRWLRAYSPLHNLRPGACYPPTLIMTADHDDRVVPAHSYKFAAAMQKAQGCANPVVLRVTPSAGHGAGKPTQRVIDDVTAKLAFIETALCGEPASDSAGVGS